MKEKPMPSKHEAAQIGRYELAIDIQSSRDTLWKALTHETNAWWLPSFRMVGEGSVVTFRAEAGGQLVERREGGGSLLWYTVQMVDPGRSIHLIGYSFPEWGGPATTMLKLAIEESGSICKLRVSDAVIGHVTEEQLESLRQGWVQLLTDGLKRHCEARS
jgi:hypothetical protein